MLTRLKVSGFKNLVDVDVRFGPFTCVAGANGAGKSNLFDAIRFLSALADRSLMEAAMSVRDEGGRTADVRSIFHRVGDRYDERMSLEAEMIVPREGIDDLGQRAEARITFLRYSIVLAYRGQGVREAAGALELVSEQLTHIRRGEAAKHLVFPHKASKWRDSAVLGQRRAPFFISTEGDDSARVIKLHQDGGSSGRPLSRSAVKLPRTVLSAANAAESPTALLARREMQSWHLLQLEPSALREPDPFTAPSTLGANGSHLAATLCHLAAEDARELPRSSTSESTPRVYSRIANRLAELIKEVQAVTIDRDERRELLTLRVVDEDGTSHPARALSDGTLRFLALAVLELHPAPRGLVCLEEPENGIHPERIPKMLELLRDIATDVEEEVGPGNPLRQVIVNTHSPALVAQVPDDSLLVAGLKDTVRDGRRFKRACFSCLPGTWRVERVADPGTIDVVARGKLLDYLNPVGAAETDQGWRLAPSGAPVAKNRKTRSRRVVDREDVKQLLMPFKAESA